MSDEIKRKQGLTELVETALRQEITQHRYGDKLPAESELAARFKVSIVKVREALTLLAREGLVERRHGRGTFVCEPPVQQWTAVVLIHDLAHPTLSFYERSVFQLVRRQFSATGLPLRGYTAFGTPSAYEPLDCPEFFQDLEAKRIRHVIPVGGALPPDLVAELAQRGIGQTCMRAEIAIERTYDMIRAGTRYLIKQGRRRLAMLAWNDPLMLKREPHTDNKPWEALFKQELDAAGLSYQEEWVKSDLHPNLMGAGWQELRDIWHSRAGKPDGLLICNDILAREAAMAIAESGIKVPDELLVVTHENLGSGQWFPFPVARLQVDPAQDVAILVREAVAAISGAAVPAVQPLESICRLIPLAGRTSIVEKPQPAMAMLNEKRETV